jgi:hypothetical protein
MREKRRKMSAKAIPNIKSKKIKIILKKLLHLSKGWCNIIGRDCEKGVLRPVFRLTRLHDMR